MIAVICAVLVFLGLLIGILCSHGIPTRAKVLLILGLVVFSPLVFRAGMNFAPLWDSISDQNRKRAHLQAADNEGEVGIGLQTDQSPNPERE